MRPESFNAPPQKPVCILSQVQRTLHVPFAYGFRPFFLAALVYGLLAVAGWILIRATGFSPLPHLPPQLWHGHEMLFGFVGAAIAGFLLTAVPSWTGMRGFAGWPLIVLTILWLAGRVTFALASQIDSLWVASAELSFLPVLAVMVGVPLLRAKNRNTPLLFVLVALWLVDATFLCAMSLGQLPLASRMLQIGLDIVLLLITVIGGRIVPSFTANALRRRDIETGIRNRPWIDRVAIASMALLVVADLVLPGHRFLPVLLAVAALTQALRMSGWGGLRTLREPIVWVLHLAYLWLPVGLALRAVHSATGADWASGWLHALGAGAAATMIVAVITRASLGHTGRALVVSRAVAIAYALLTLGAVTRVAATGLPYFYEWLLRIAASLWVVAFAIVLFVYAPILLRPRVDGRHG